MLASHAVDPSSNPGSGRILTWTPLVDSYQCDIMSTTRKRLTSSSSGLNVHYEAGDKRSLLTLHDLYLYC